MDKTGKMKTKNTITSSPKTRKEYSYEINGVTLSFILRQDNSSELVSFKKLLDSALVDVENDIKSSKK